MMFLGQKQLVTSSFVELQKSQQSRPICWIRFRHILSIASTSTVIGIIEFTQAKILFHANSFTAAADLLRSSEESITVSSKDAIRNNIACIEAKRGKFNLSQHLLQQASFAGSLFPSGPVNRAAIIQYNTGLVLLSRGEYLEAFDCLEGLLPYFDQNPHLWLRMAECCVHHFLAKVDESSSAALGSSLLQLRPLGNRGGGGRGLILSTTHQHATNAAGAGERGGLSLLAAVGYLSNSLFLLRRSRASQSQSQAPRGPTAGTAGGTATGLGEADRDSNHLGPGLPMRPLTAAAGRMLEEAVLLKLSYTQLRLGDTVRALANAGAVLVDSVAAADGTETPAPPLTHPQSASNRELAELYCIEALCSLGRVAEAIRWLSPRTAGGHVWLSRGPPGTTAGTAVGTTVCNPTGDSAESSTVSGPASSGEEGRRRGSAIGVIDKIGTVSEEGDPTDAVAPATLLAAAATAGGRAGGERDGVSMNSQVRGNHTALGVTGSFLAGGHIPSAWACDGTRECALQLCKAIKGPLGDAQVSSCSSTATSTTASSSARANVAVSGSGEDLLPSQSVTDVAGATIGIAGGATIGAAGESLAWAVVQVNRAAVLCLVDDLVAAYRLLAEVLRVLPAFAPAVRGMAYVLLRKGRHKDAVALIVSRRASS